MGNLCLGGRLMANGEGQTARASSNNHHTNGNHLLNSSHQPTTQERNACGAESCSSNGFQQPNFQEQPQNGLVTQNSAELSASSIKNDCLEDNLHYKMDHPHSGIAIIFNHYKYKFDRRSPRKGTHHDKKRLAAVFQSLNFDVHNHNDDLKYDQIQKALEEVRQKQHADNDCLVVAVLTHGGINGCLSAFDADYSLSAVWEPFTDENCPSLKGKPRLFFIQACRGIQVMNPVELQYRTQTDAVPYSTPIPNIPEHFYVAFATCEGYYSWRSESDGSWFIQSLCEQIEKYKYTNDLNFIMTRVLHSVATGYQSVCPDKEKLHETKQMPCVVTKLTRRLLFKEKPQQ